jgi:hypothetical protein
VTRGASLRDDADVLINLAVTKVNCSEFARLEDALRDILRK